MLGIVQGEFPVEDTSGDVDRVVCRAVRHASASASAPCVVPTPGCAVSAVIWGRRCVHVLVNCAWKSVKSQGVRKKRRYTSKSAAPFSHDTEKTKKGYTTCNLCNLSKKLLFRHVF